MKNHIKQLESILGRENLLIEETEMKDYAHDETEDLSFLPDCVCFPRSTEEVSALMAYCNEHALPVTASGARTGLSGGALAVRGGVVLSMAKMNEIVDIDTNNQQVTTQPGVITQVLQESVRERGLFYPPDPASKGSCFIGGNVAENAGGPKAVKYGVTKDYVLNLEVVLADGTVMWTGANVLKNSTGYNLTQLIVGSEGTLAVITKVVLRLIPHPRKDISMLVPFNSSYEACQAVSAIFNEGNTPSGLEFMERDAIDWTLSYVQDFQMDVDDTVEAHLLIEVDGNDADRLMEECEKIMQVLEVYNTGDMLMAETEAQKDNLWAMRRKVSEAVKSNSVYKEEDTVVPRFHLPQLLEGVKKIGEQYGFQSVCYGHAGDGNLHVNIVKGELTDHQWNEELPLAIREIFELTKSLGGTISGEHGIGYVQKNYMDVMFQENELQLMRSIKNVFDPKNILNPDKIWPGK